MRFGEGLSFFPHTILEYRLTISENSLFNPVSEAYYVQSGETPIINEGQFVVTLNYLAFYKENQQQ